MNPNCLHSPRTASSLAPILLLLCCLWSQAQSDWTAVESGFRQPPQRAGIRCFWWWLNGNVTKEAITRDLEEMRAKGFSGAMIFDAGGAEQHGNAQVPAGPMFGTPEWRALVQHAVTEADRLGLELSMNIQSGWNLGGPRVSAAESAKQLTWSETTVKGPVAFQDKLPAPKSRDDFYRDVAVLAFPLRTGKGPNVRTCRASASSAQRGHPAESGADGDRDTFWVSESAEPGGGPTAGKPEWLLLDLGLPATVAAVTVAGRPGYGPKRAEIQKSDDARSFDTVATFDLPADQEATARFQAVQCRYIRLLIRAAYDPRTPDVPRNVQVAEVRLLDGEGRPVGGSGGKAARRPIRDLDRKSAFHELGGSAPDCRPLLFDVPADPGEEDARLADMVNLSALLQPDGTLRWSAPEGEWRVLRFGCTSTGARVSTASGAWQGRVIDYLSADAFNAYWDRELEPVLKDVAAYTGRTLKYLATDSWECGGMNWTPGFEAFFRERRGYDPLPLLPVVAGCIVESREASNAFLADLRKTLADAVADRHYAVFAERARAHGMGIHPESAGPHAGPFDGLKDYGRSAIPMSECWVPSPHRPTPDDRFFVKQAASAAHTYGLRLVGAETFTSIGPQWDDVLWAAQKPTFDHEVCEGLSLAFVHTFTCSPPSMGVPGQEYFAGTHFNPQCTWWPCAGEFVKYLSRCQFLLQRGRFVADALYYYGDHVPNIARRKGADPARALPGFDYDALDEELLVGSLVVKDGRLTLPARPRGGAEATPAGEAGMSYRVLVLPDHKVLSLAALRKVGVLVHGGATVLGLKPQGAVSLEGGDAGREEFRRLADELWGEGEASGVGCRVSGGQGVPPDTRKANPGSFPSVSPDTRPSTPDTRPGRVIWGKSAREVLLADGVKADVEFRAGADAELGWIHCRLGEADVYFVSNQRDREERAEAAFRVAGRQPELWDPVTGAIRDAGRFAETGGCTAVAFRLESFGSQFIVFRKMAKAGPEGRVTRSGAAAGEGGEANLKPLATIEGPWTVSFDPRWGGPERIVFTALEDWTKRPEAGIRNYSGKAVYKAAFSLEPAVFGGGAAGRSIGPFYLELGRVADTGVAQVRLNGTDVGTAWCPPFRLDVSRALKPGRNDVEIAVYNSWRNRLVGDRGQPPEKRFTRTNIGIRPEWTLVPSGLLGPVRVVAPVR